MIDSLLWAIGFAVVVTLVVILGAVTLPYWYDEMVRRHRMRRWRRGDAP
jgi:hypothetical protein